MVAITRIGAAWDNSQPSTWNTGMSAWMKGAIFAITIIDLLGVRAATDNGRLSELVRAANFGAVTGIIIVFVVFETARCGSRFCAEDGIETWSQPVEALL